LIALMLGLTMGLIAGYYGGWIDELVMRLADVTLAFPTLLLLIAMAAASPTDRGSTPSPSARSGVERCVPHRSPPKTKLHSSTFDAATVPSSQSRGASSALRSPKRRHPTAPRHVLACETTTHRAIAP